MRWILLPVLLAACGGPPADSPQGRCDRQSYDDPEVKALTLQGLGGSDVTYSDMLPIIARARQKAIQRCLAPQGLAPLGGVQQVKPAY